MSGFFRGTSYEQDARWNNKQEKLKKSLKFPAVFKKKVDLSKVKLPAIRAWVTKRLLELLGAEDDILPGMVMNMLESGKQGDASLDPRDLQINITGFLGAKAKVFMEELWELLVEASRSPLGIPSQLLEAEKQQIEQQQQAQAKLEEELRRVREQIQQKQYGLQLPQQVQSAVPAAPALAQQQAFVSVPTVPVPVLPLQQLVKTELLANGNHQASAEAPQASAADRDYSPERWGRGRTANRSSYSPSPRRPSRRSRDRDRGRNSRRSRSRSRGRDRDHRGDRGRDRRDRGDRDSSSSSSHRSSRHRRSRSRSRDRAYRRSDNGKSGSSTRSSRKSSRRHSSRSRSPQPRQEDIKVKKTEDIKEGVKKESNAEQPQAAADGEPVQQVKSEELELKDQE